MSGKFMTIKEAAEMLGVTPLTLRNWDKSGKLPTTRHPMSNYRIYKTEDLEKLMKDIEAGTVPTKAKPRSAPKRKLTARKLIVRSIREE
ncbi:MAG: MerR family DNA-binding transcriptional regulator [Candidatus Taylorbacteria bacterium]|nr:MerR family DNA-binding transcriptional regulator [Candidatus Taylorbacteria bacterium]